MSMIAAALEFFHARKWLVELILVIALCGGVWIWYHGQIEKAIAQGVTAQKAEDDRASAELQAKVDKLTAENLKLAKDAKAAYDDTLKGIHDYMAANPVGVSQLCKPANAHNSQVGMRPAGGTHPGNEGGPSAQELGSGMPTPDNGFADDRRTLLGAFAALFDAENAVIREFQARP